MKKTQRLDKVLSNFGFGTRSEIKKLTKAGVIVVDNEIVKDPSVHVDPEKSEIYVNGERLYYRQFIYLMMNKPRGVISATFDNRHRTVLDLVPEEYTCFDLFPAGRLDIDTEGLMLLTNDGQLAHELLSPKKHVPKKYYALIDGIVTEEDVNRFSEGIVLDDGYKTMGSKLTVLKQGKRSEIELVIYEGKFHQVKRMFETVGKKVLFLKRIQMGGLKLDETLPPGKCRELLPEEVELLKKSDI